MADRVLSILELRFTVLRFGTSSDIAQKKSSRQYEHLTLAQVYAALAHYHDNRAAIDAEIEADEVEANRIEQEYLQRRKIPA